MKVRSFGHIGLSVRDAARTAEFYAAVFGFEHGEHFDLSSGFERRDDAPPLPLICHFMTLGDLRLALIQYAVPQASAVPRPMHQLGIANIAFNVDAFDPLLERIEAEGGRVHRETLLEGPHGSTVHCSDPDGARIELMCLR